MVRAEVLSRLFVPVFSVFSAAVLYAVLFPDHLHNLAHDVLKELKGVPGGEEDTVQDYVETKFVPCAVCGERAVVVRDGKALCAEHALLDR